MIRARRISPLHLCALDGSSGCSNIQKIPLSSKLLTMLKTKENIQKVAEEMITKFKEEMTELTGISPVVIMSFSDDMLHPLLLQDLESIINEHFMEMCPKSIMFPDGIRTKSRKRELVVYRHLFYFMASKMGYGPSFIAAHMDFDHATAIHGTRAFTDLLESRDKQALQIFNAVHNAYQKRLESTRTVQSDNSEGANSKPVLSPVLYAGIDQSKLNKLASGSTHTKGKQQVD